MDKNSKKHIERFVEDIQKLYKIKAMLKVCKANIARNDSKLNKNISV